MARAAPQSDLFDAPAPAAPEGFAYREDFLSTAEEAELLAWLETLPFQPFQFQGFEGLRRVVSFGWRYDFSRSHLERADDLPVELVAVRARAGALAGLAPAALQQVLINEYRPGAPIGWHRDRGVFGKVAGISLKSACRFRFRRRTAAGFERAAVQLAPRSAYVLSGEARSVWEHSIPAVTEHRYSITFRNFREG